MLMDKFDHLPEVRKQYEELPYPARNPLDEAKFLRATCCDCLDRINYYCYAGKKEFLRGTRILVAAGGTGDSAIFLAEQLRGTDSEIVYLDFSKASMEIARKRADIRGLQNITWIHDSLLNIPSLKLGAFDYISCTGALHHLEDPNAGLRALKTALNEDGAMGLMVYARYGRTPVYQVQSLMKLINQHESDTHAKIDNTRKVLDALPSNHWYKLSNAKHKGLSDTELYDCFLHSQDRSYTIPELYDLVEGAGLKLGYLFPDLDQRRNDLNDPGLYINDAELLASIRMLDFRQQQAIAELMHGRIATHNFYVVNEVHPIPCPDDLEYIPYLPIQLPRDTYNSLGQLVSTSINYVNIKILSLQESFGFQKTQNIESFFKYLDGERTIKEIYDAIIAVAPIQCGHLSYESLGQEFREMFSVMTSRKMLFLRHKSVSAYKTTEEIQARISKKTSI